MQDRSRCRSPPRTGPASGRAFAGFGGGRRAPAGGAVAQPAEPGSRGCRPCIRLSRMALAPADPGRSEEHTSELQSLMRISYAVFCLKKKKNNNEQHNETQRHKGKWKAMHEDHMRS